MTRPLKAVFFDIDDTLYSTTAFAERARRASLEAMRQRGLKLELDAALREFEEVIEEFGSNHGAHYDKFLRRLPPAVRAGTNPAVLIAAAVIGYHTTKHQEMQPFPDVRTILPRLAKTPLLLGTISNGMEIKQAEKLLRLGLYDFLDPRAIFISDQVGISKPNPKIFLHAREELGVAPGEALYVGDRPAHDVDPAQAAGLRTVLVHRGGKYEGKQAQTRPDHEVKDFFEFADLLRAEYGIEC